MKTSQKISFPAAALVLVCFFLPWVAVSCSGQELVSLNGMDLAAGKVIDPGFDIEAQRVGGDPYLYIIPITAIVVAILALSGSSTGGGGAGMGQIVAGGVGLGIMVLKWLSVNDEVAAAVSEATQAMGGVIDISLRFGVWGTLLGLGGLLLGGLVALGESSRAPDDEWQEAWDEW